MAAREFMFEIVDHAGQKLGANKVQCHACGGAEYLTQTGTKRNPVEFVERYFRNKGWRLGDRADADLCPSCQGRKPKAKVMQMDAAKADAPREMSREDRRIIFAKIDELYLDDRSGYVAPWTDAAVARDLGVPRAWVAGVRDELFGPEGSNADYQAFEQDIAGLRADLTRCQEAISAAQSVASTLGERIGALEKTALRINRDLAG